MGALMYINDDGFWMPNNHAISSQLSPGEEW